MQRLKEHLKKAYETFQDSKLETEYDPQNYTCLQIAEACYITLEKACYDVGVVLTKEEKEGECVLNAKDCKKLMKVLANYGWLNDFDAECLYGALEWALYNNVDICVKASDTPFK